MIPSPRAESPSRCPLASDLTPLLDGRTPPTQHEAALTPLAGPCAAARGAYRLPMPSTQTLSQTITPLRIKRLSPDASLPAYKSELAAGMDLTACLPAGPVTLAPGEIAKIPTGLAIAFEAGFEAQVRPRSGLASNHGVTLPNAPGTIDADYRGEVIVPLINLGREPYTITHGARIAQMVIAPVARAQIVEAEHLDQTERGTGGFGSTGTH